MAVTAEPLYRSRPCRVQGHYGQATGRAGFRAVNAEPLRRVQGRTAISVRARFRAEPSVGSLLPIHRARFRTTPVFPSEPPGGIATLLPQQGLGVQGRIVGSGNLVFVLWQSFLRLIKLCVCWVVTSTGPYWECFRIPRQEEFV